MVPYPIVRIGRGGLAVWQPHFRSSAGLVSKLGRTIYILVLALPFLPLLFPPHTYLVGTALITKRACLLGYSALHIAVVT